MLEELAAPWKAEAENETCLNSWKSLRMLPGRGSRWDNQGAAGSAWAMGAPQEDRDQLSSCVFLEPCFTQSTKRWCVKISPDNFHVLKSSIGPEGGAPPFTLPHHRIHYFHLWKNESG